MEFHCKHFAIKYIRYIQARFNVLYIFESVFGFRTYVCGASDVFLGRCSIYFCEGMYSFKETGGIVGRRGV